MLVRAGNILQPILHFTDGASEVQIQNDFPQIICLLVENARAEFRST